VNAVAPAFQKGMKELAKSPIVGEIRGEGLVLGIEFIGNKDTLESFPAEWAVGAYFGAQCQAIGMLVRIAGDIIMISPPLISTAAELQQIVKFAEAALKGTERYIVQLQMSKQ
jgi:4-aminobutyrate--pyruvate transaminase